MTAPMTTPVAEPLPSVWVEGRAATIDCDAEVPATDGAGAPELVAAGPVAIAVADALGECVDVVVVEWVAAGAVEVRGWVGRDVCVAGWVGVTDGAGRTLFGVNDGLLPPPNVHAWTCPGSVDSFAGPVCAYAQELLPRLATQYDQYALDGGVTMHLSSAGVGY